MSARPAGRGEQAHSAADELTRALGMVGCMVSLCQAERLGGRASGRVMIVMTADMARGHAQRCRRMAQTEALEA